MSGFLDTIVSHKLSEVRAARKRVSTAELMNRIQPNSSRKSLLQTLANPAGVHVIAEIKRASPSKGILRRSLDAARMATIYEKAGAAAISVLTERRFFMGSPEDLVQVKTATRLPVLRKDFILSAYQVIESAVLGADVILLIARLLELEQLRQYLNLCQDLNLEALVEVHSSEDIKKVSQTDARLIGINNRDLMTFDTQLFRALELREQLRSDQIPIVASGIQDEDDVRLNCQAGLKNFLIGESLVRAESPGDRLRSYLEVWDA